MPRINNIPPNSPRPRIATLSTLSRSQLLESPQVHLLLQQRNHVRVKGFPVRVLQVILLRTLVEVALDDAEVLLVVDRLHNEPRKRLMVLGVDGGSLLEFGLKLLDAFLVGFGAEVYECFFPPMLVTVYHAGKK